MERQSQSLMGYMKRSAKSVAVKTALLGATALLGVACGKQDSSFSLLSDGATFRQNSAEINGKIDILFVIDNSGSMKTSQDRLAANIQTFFEKFDQKKFDYRIAVTTSDAYKVYFGGNALMAKFKDGVDPKHTGVFVVTPDTPNAQPTFITNVLQGIYGSGDERVFQSIPAALDSAQNASFGFPRADAFLSVIILSDEDDFSNDGSGSIDDNTNAPYTNPAIHPVQKYVDYLDKKMGVTGGDRSSKYNVNAISIFDQTCLNSVYNGTQRIGKRYGELVDATGGIKGSLCGEFGTTLSEISHKIIELRTRFTLGSEPNPATIVVTIDGVNVPRIADGSPQPWNGFYYHADDNSISFHGDYVPGPGVAIGVSFDPNGLR